MILALLVLLADGLVKVPAANWTAVEVRVDSNNATVSCSFDVRTQGSKVQALFMARSDAERFNRGRTVNPLYSTGFESAARFRYRVSQAGDYVLLLDNRLESRHAAEVAVRIDLTRGVDARELSSDQRRLIVTLSLLFLGAVTVFSARQFLKHGT
jgi:hypothetical protein